MSGGHLLSPFSIGYVKGWKRSVCLLVVLSIVRKLEIGASIPSNIKAGYFFFLDVDPSQGLQDHPS